jgi:lambda repressor-like predicted transcriptional regulator
MEMHEVMRAAIYGCGGSMAKIERAVGIHRGTLASQLNGRYPVTLKNLILISEYLAKKNKTQTYKYVVYFLQNNKDFKQALQNDKKRGEK